MRRRRAFALLALTGSAAALPLAAAAAPLRPSADSATPRSWAATAAADGVRVSVVVNDFLVVSNVVDAGGPSTQAVVNAFGDSRGYAAFPYPGEIVLTAHGLSQGAAPKYPLIAQSDPTQPKSDVGTGPYRLHAESADDKSSADARTNAGNDSVVTGLTHSTANAAHDPQSGTVTADAESTAEGISIAGVLSIGRVHSHAQMISTAGKPVQRASDTELADVTVAGQQVGVTDKGLVLAGTNIPLPDDSTANAALAAAGVSVHYVSAAKTPTSTVAPGLSVDVEQEVPGVGPTTVTYVFGQASATAQATGASSDTGLATPSLAGAAGTTSTGSGPTSSGAVPTAAAPPSTANPGATPESPPITAGAPQQSQGGYSLATRSGPSSESFYLVIAAGAVVMVGAAQLFRILAVKLAWT